MGDNEFRGLRVDIDEDHWEVVGPGGAVRRSDGRWPGLLGMPALFGALLDEPVAEHHILAAHGEGLFTGLSERAEEWVTRAEDLLRHLDRLRVIVQEWPPGHQMMSRTELKSRGWNDAAIGALIEPAAVLPNPHYGSGGDMVLFDTRRVFELERTAPWFAATARLRHRRAFAAHHWDATRATRAAGLPLAARHPADCSAELAEIAVTHDSPAVRALALDGLQRYWHGRQWRPSDLAEAQLAPVAVLLGDAEVAAAALACPDPSAVRVAVSRAVDALAG